MLSVEYFPIVNEDGLRVGRATRQECHSGSFLLHPVVHLHVFNSQGDLFMQKRADDKDIQPGKWDTSVGGHVDDGETVEEALMREVKEELNIRDFHPVFVFRYKFVSDREAELVHTHYTVYNGTITPDPGEISEGKFWTLSAISNSIGTNIFTPNFEREWKMLVEKNIVKLSGNYSGR